MTQKNDVATFTDGPQLVTEKKPGQSDQELNWKKARETMAQQAQKIKVLEQEKSKTETQKTAEKKALDTLIELLDSPNQPLKLEAAKLVLLHTSKY